MFDRRVPHDGLRRRRLILDLAFAAAAALAAAAIAVVALRAWRMDLGVPIAYASDALLNLGWIQNVVDTGWYLEAPRLGAPFGQEHHDYPLGPDQLHFVLLRGLTVLTGDAAVSANLFYLLTFPLAALTSFWALRQLGVRAPVGAVGAVLYAIVPYHFLRGEIHLFLSAYETVPLSCFLIVATAQGRAMFGLGTARGRVTVRDRVLAVLGGVTLALLVASGGGYYAVFTLVLLAAATLLGAFRRRSRPVIVSGLLLCALIAGFVGLNSLPTFQYRLENGANTDVPVRDPVETERHSLRPVTLILPISGHRLPLLADAAAEYERFPASGERGESLGVVGAMGVLLLLLVAVGSTAGAWARGARWARHRSLAALSLVALLMGIIGGGSTVMALLVSPQFRAWARISIFIAFFALLGVCLVLSWLWRRARTRSSRTFAAAGLVALLVVGALDQTSNRFVPPYTALAAEFRADRAFVQSVEAMLPLGAAIYQLPHRRYPEGGTREESDDYDHMRGYIHSRELAWSFGAIKGREAGWQPFVHTARAAQALPLLAGAGFSAIWVDREAYRDRVVEADLRRVLGTEPIVSPDQRFVVFDIRGYSASLAQRTGEPTWSAVADALLRPVWPRWRSGTRWGSLSGDEIVRPVARNATLELFNDGHDGRQVVLSVSFRTVGPSSVEIQWPDGSVESIATSSAATDIERPLVLAAGTNTVQFSTNAQPIAGETGPAWMRAMAGNLWVIDPILLDLAHGDEGQAGAAP